MCLSSSGNLQFIPIRTDPRFLSAIRAEAGRQGTAQQSDSAADEQARLQAIAPQSDRQTGPTLGSAGTGPKRDSRAALGRVGIRGGGRRTTKLGN